MSILVFGVRGAEAAEVRKARSAARGGAVGASRNCRMALWIAAGVLAGARLLQAHERSRDLLIAWCFGNRVGQGRAVVHG